MMKPLVLCIDRDDDIGRKTKIKGPIVGIQKNLEVAQALALADPADTDVNAIYGAVKTAKELGADVVTLTGDFQVGVISDAKIVKQLEDVLKETKASSVILVSDGAEDEQVIPIIQSRVKIDSIQTVIVRQSKELEKAYFKIIHFVREISKHPDVARFIFALPGVALVLLAIGGMQALSLIMGVAGVYLILKGTGLEEEVFSRIAGFMKSLSSERVSSLIYLAALVMLVFGVLTFQSDLSGASLTLYSLVASVDNIASFILNSSSIDLVALALITGMVGRIIDDYASKNYMKIRKYLMLLALVILVRVILQSGASFIENPESYGLTSFVSNMILGVIAFMVWIKTTEYWFINEINIMKSIIKDLLGKDVVGADNKHIGRVSKVLLEGLELSALKVGRRVIARKDILSTEGVIKVNVK
jgi:putative membrane protein